MVIQTRTSQELQLTCWKNQTNNNNKHNFCFPKWWIWRRHRAHKEVNDGQAGAREEHVRKGEPGNEPLLL